MIDFTRRYKECAQHRQVFQGYNFIWLTDVRSLFFYVRLIFGDIHGALYDCISKLVFLETEHYEGYLAAKHFSRSENLFDSHMVYKNAH